MSTAFKERNWLSSVTFVSFVFAAFLFMPQSASCRAKSPPLKAFVEHAQFIVGASVVSKTYESDPRFGMVTRYGLEYNGVTKGNREDLPDSVIVAGGRTDNKSLFVSDTPQLQLGKQYILFLRFDNDYCPVLGWKNGAYRIEYEENLSSVLKTGDGRRYLHVGEGLIKTEAERTKANLTTPEQFIGEVSRILSGADYKEKASGVGLPPKKDLVKRKIFSANDLQDEPYAGYVFWDYYWVEHYAYLDFSGLGDYTIEGNGALGLAGVAAANWFYNICNNTYKLDADFSLFGDMYTENPPPPGIEDRKNVVGWSSMGPCDFVDGVTLAWGVYVPGLENIPGLADNPLRTTETDIAVNPSCPWTSDTFTGTMGHELGHVFGLDHDCISDFWNIMCVHAGNTLAVVPTVNDCQTFFVRYSTPTVTSTSITGPDCVFANSDTLFRIGLHFDNGSDLDTSSGIWSVAPAVGSMTNFGEFTAPNLSSNQSVLVQAALADNAPPNLTASRGVLIVAAPPSCTSADFSAYFDGAYYEGNIASYCSGSFTIKWQGSCLCQAESVTLQRATKPDFSDAIGVYNGSNASYNEVNLVPGFYYYRLKLTNKYGQTPWFNLSSLYIGTAAPPSISYPLGLTNDGNIDISWPQVLMATGYTLQRATKADFSDANTIYNAPGGGYNGWTEHLGRDKEGTYYYRVRAINRCGTSAWTAGGPMTLCWRVSSPIAISYPLSDADGNFPVSWGWAYSGEISYTLQRATSASFAGAVTVYEGPNSVLDWQQTGLAPGTYYYRVRANTACGHSEWKQGGPITVGGACVLPSIPTNVSATDGTYTNRVDVNLNWHWGTEYFEVWRNTTNNSATANKIGQDSARPYADWSPVAGTFYYYWVKACRYSCGCSGFSAADRGYAGAIPGIETVSNPSAPTGPGTAVAGVAILYSATGATSSQGHALQYQFDWYGDGSDLSDWGTSTQTKAWTVTGWKNVKARARCASDIYVMSDWSPGLSVSISPYAIIYVRQNGLCGGKTPCYTSIQSGINSAQSATLIETSLESYPGNIVLDLNQVIIVQGGWDTNFTSISSSTTVQGSITIRNGTMIVENIKVASP